VRKGHEEESLLSLFPKGFIVYQGKRTGPLSDKIAQIKQQGSLFRIQAPFGDSARAIEQTDLKCERLNSGDAFIVSNVGGDQVYLWLGEGANEAEQKLGRALFEQFFTAASVKQEFKEGQEEDAFWEAFEGGKTEYSNTKDTGIAAGFEPRLFHASNNHGYFHVEEIPNFSQDDMMNDDIMLLDAYQTIYVWIGNQSNKFEKNGAYKTANRYIQSVRDERDKESVQIVEIEAGKEPPSFTVFFPEWRIEKAQKWLEIGEQAAVAKKQEEEQKKAA
jgi:Gelsolin repeat